MPAKLKEHQRKRERRAHATQYGQAQLKGLRNEIRAINIVNDLVTADHIPAQSAERTGRFSERDKAGIDIAIPTKYGQIDLQIKSSAWHAEKFQEENPDSNIIVVVVNEYRSDRDIKREITKKLIARYRTLKNERLQGL